MTFPGNFKELSRTFPRHFLEISRKPLGNFQAKLQEMSRKFQGHFLEISKTFPRHFPGNIPGISKTFPGTFRDMSRNIPGHFREISGGNKTNKKTYKDYISRKNEIRQFNFFIIFLTVLYGNKYRIFDQILGIWIFLGRFVGDIGGFFG